MSFDLQIKDGDLVIASSGDLKTVENTDKLIQDIIKIISTPVGGNPFFPWYGSYATTTLIGNNFDFAMNEQIAQSQLVNALETLQKLQKIQEKNGQVVTPAELLAAIRSVNIEMGYREPRLFKIFVQVLTKALTLADTSLEVSS